VFSSRMAGVSAEGLRFVVIGAINTAVGYAVFFVAATWLLSDLRFGYLLAVALSYAIATPIGYTLHRRVVFRAESSPKSFARFVGVNLSAIGLNFVGLPIAVEGLGMTPQLGQALVLIIVVVFTYVGHKFLSFRDGKDSSPW